MYTTANWIKISDPSQLQSGDIFSCPSKVPKSSPIFPNLVVPFISHVGMIIVIDNKLHVIHNPFDGSPEIVPFDKVFDGSRSITKIIRTNLSTEHILQKFIQCTEKYCQIHPSYSMPYKFFHRNCEDFVRSISGFDIGIDQRFVWFTSIIIIVVLLILIFRKKT